MKYLLFAILLFCFTTKVSSQQKFTSLNELLEYSNKKSISLQSNSIQLEQANKAIVASKLAIIDPQINLPSSFINNTKLPVNLFPAEAFGGQPGAYREVESGVQYNTSFSQIFDLKLVNVSSWENLKLAKLNVELNESNYQISLKSIQDNIANVYYNIIILQEQLKSTQKNILTSDSLFQIAQKKYNAGFVRQQDVNDTRIVLLTYQENAKQIDYLMKQSYNNLKIIMDIPVKEEIVIDHVSLIDIVVHPEVNNNHLNLNNYSIKEQYALSNYKLSKKILMPTLSLVGNNSYQLYNTEFKVFSGSWIKSNYIGLKLNIQLPNASTIANTTKAKYEYQIANKAREQSKIKAELEIKQLENEYLKNLSQFNSNQEILMLRKDTYQKNKSLYTEGLVGLDQTINSLNAMTNAEYNEISARMNTELALAKIDINNKIK